MARLRVRCELRSQKGGKREKFLVVCYSFWCEICYNLRVKTKKGGKPKMEKGNQNEPRKNEAQKGAPKLETTKEREWTPDAKLNAKFAKMRQKWIKTGRKAEKWDFLAEHGIMVKV